jgi:hypothetical protein
MADAVGFDTSSGDPVPFLACANDTYAYALEDAVLSPIEKGGELMDFWWYVQP